MVPAATGLMAYGPARAFTFDEAEKLDKVEGNELLSRARQAAASGDTGGARRFIAQALGKGAAPAQVRAAEQVVAQAEEKADQARRAEETRRQAEAEARNRPIAGSTGRQGGDGRTMVHVETDCVTGSACFTSNLTVSGGPGKFERTGASNGFGKIERGGYPTLAGQYTYSFVIAIGSRRCTASGSFTLDGSHGIATLKHYPDCQFSDIRMS